MRLLNEIIYKRTYTGYRRRNFLPLIAIVLAVIFLVTIFLTYSKVINPELNNLSNLSDQNDVKRFQAQQKVEKNYQTVLEVVNQYVPGIICWGGSLTVGVGGNRSNYPKTIDSLLKSNIINKFDPAYNVENEWKFLSTITDYPVNIEVLNMGVEGETTDTILGRNGAVPFVLAEDAIIPAGKSPVELKLKSQNGGEVAPLKKGNAGIESVTIADIEGVITYNKKTKEYTFVRNIEGTAADAPEGTKVISSGSKVGLDYITVIFIGEDDADISISELIAKQKAILNHQERNNDRYIIVGLPTGTKKSRAELEAAMQKEFGDRYINLREYMSTKAMEDAGKQATPNDLVMLEQGSTPQSLLSDKIHLSGPAYELTGKLIYERMDELGYFDEIKIAMGLMTGNLEGGSTDSSGTLIDLSENSQKAKKAAEEKIKSNYDAAVSALQKYLPGVVCWGDSLTAGSGGAGTSYPKVLKKLIEDKIFSKFDPAYNVDPAWKYLSVVDSYSLSTDILNMGIAGENTNTILGRNGAVPFVLAEDIKIPEDRTTIEIKLKSKNGANVYPLRQGNAGMETVTISGIEGVIEYNKATDEYLFTRSSDGEETVVEAETEIITSGSKVGKDYVTVIFMGQNDTKLVPEELIAKQKAILNSQGRNKDRYIIIGLHTGTKESRAELESAMKSAFGNNYINLREYMATKGLKDADIEATSEDLALMAEGSTPKSLLNDKIHFNAKGYELLGNLIFERMNDLGYFKEIKSAMKIK